MIWAVSILAAAVAALFLMLLIVGARLRDTILALYRMDTVVRSHNEALLQLQAAFEEQARLNDAFLILPSKTVEAMVVATCLKPEITDESLQHFLNGSATKPSDGSPLI